MASSEITPTARRIDKIISRIEEGDIRIPAFQGGFVWSEAQVIDLLDSIYHDYPIGSIILWNSNEKLKSTRNIGGFLIPDREPQYPVNYVLDGHQRLAAIYGVFCRDRRKASETGGHDFEPDIFKIYFDFDDEVFVPERCLNKEHANLDMTSIFDVDRFFEAVNKLEAEYKQRALFVLSKFMNYEVPIITTTKCDEKEIGIIIKRIKSIGTGPITP